MAVLLAEVLPLHGEALQPPLLRHHMHALAPPPPHPRPAAVVYSEEMYTRRSACPLSSLQSSWKRWAVTTQITEWAAEAAEVHS